MYRTMRRSIWKTPSGLRLSTSIPSISAVPVWKHSFGEMKVYYDNAFTNEKQVYTKIDVAFGNMVLYVPKTWQVINNIDCSFGAVNIKNQKSYTPQEDAPVLVITGSVAFGAAEIIYM